MGADIAKNNFIRMGSYIFLKHAKFPFECCRTLAVKKAANDWNWKTDFRSA